MTFTTNQHIDILTVRKLSSTDEQTLVTELKNIKNDSMHKIYLFFLYC